jgi:glycosyltransferase involved in cell wall biosynthesis
MKIVFVTETFSPVMGYLQNTLPKYFARFGAETHVITGDLVPGYAIKEMAETHRELSGDSLPIGTHTMDGYHLHILPHQRQMGYVRLIGLRKTIAVLRPDIVQTMAAVGWIPADAAIAKLSRRYRLFTGNHNGASTFLPDGSRVPRLAHLKRFVPGRVISLATEKCYAVTDDCGEIAWRYLGVQRQKVSVMHLGTDPEWFYPVSTEGHGRVRAALRCELGVGPEEILCIYTGKMTKVKRPRILAEAVAQLRREGIPFRVLFVGCGPEAGSVRQTKFAIVRDPVPFRQLGDYYRASDIGVWPGDESISMLDGMGCGLPLVISDRVKDRKHVEGNGKVCRYNDIQSLVDVLRELGDAGLRHALGVASRNKAISHYNVMEIASGRLKDYCESLGFPA